MADYSPLTDPSTWRLHHDNREVARLRVTGTDMPWVHAEVEALPGFEEFGPLFAEQERATEQEDWERADACYERIRAALVMSFPDGTPVAEFLLHVHGDGTAAWRWSDEPFEEFDEEQ
ncbi:hypothetical protein [Kitasatospora viridis]|uniref:Uncharacterized protein n=1 Tax=Kitasatospora viridis TaxID=281105 RepID=A0A561TS79_9ACTN|nr:hypothetical protein [Kitasatospora viridis]TWF89973.1 hypothetical protein FHX73_1317 [Kitasatospora viridis]